MNVLVIDNGSRHADKIADLFPEANVTKKWFTDTSIHETTTDTVVVLSGGHKLGIVKNPDAFKNEIDFVRNFGGPIIGICLGFELIAQTYGSQLYVMNERREGIHSIVALDSGQSILPDGKASVYEAHRWHVRNLLQPLVVLAISDDGVEILRHENRPIYAMQFHPEVFESNDGKEIFERIMHSLGIIEKT